MSAIKFTLVFMMLFFFGFSQDTAVKIPVITKRLNGVSAKFPVRAITSKQTQPVQQPKQPEEVKAVEQPKQPEEIRAVEQLKQPEEIRTIEQPKKTEEIKTFEEPKKSEEIKKPEE